MTVISNSVWVSVGYLDITLGFRATNFSFFCWIVKVILCWTCGNPVIAGQVAVIVFSPTELQYKLIEAVPVVVVLLVSPDRQDELSVRATVQLPVYKTFSSVFRVAVKVNWNSIVGDGFEDDKAIEET